MAKYSVKLRAYPNDNPETVDFDADFAGIDVNVKDYIFYKSCSRNAVAVFPQENVLYYLRKE